jgi:hypothetical protein
MGDSQVKANLEQLLQLDKILINISTITKNAIITTIYTLQNAYRRYCATGNQKI